MGYFANGTEGMAYEEQYCARCVHQGPEEGPGCAVMLAHDLYNYDQCNDENSILHLLIPRSEEGWNQECVMFREKNGHDQGVRAVLRQVVEAPQNMVDLMRNHDVKIDDHDDPMQKLAFTLYTELVEHKIAAQDVLENLGEEG